jgi:hypothetical protein
MFSTTCLLENDEIMARICTQILLKRAADSYLAVDSRPHYDFVCTDSIRSSQFGD